jgi:hypothetical protein
MYPVMPCYQSRRPVNAYQGDAGLFPGICYTCMSVSPQRRSLYHRYSRSRPRHIARAVLRHSKQTKPPQSSPQAPLQPTRPRRPHHPHDSRSHSSTHSHSPIPPRRPSHAASETCIPSWSSSCARADPHLGPACRSPWRRWRCRLRWASTS